MGEPEEPGLAVFCCVRVNPQTWGVLGCLIVASSWTASPRRSFGGFAPVIHPGPGAAF